MKRSISYVQFWPIAAAVLALLFGAWEAYGCYQSDNGLATNRAWIAQVFLGLASIIVTLVVAVPALFLKRDRKSVVATMFTLIGVGVTPTIVRLLWGPFSQLFLHRVY